MKISKRFPIYLFLAMSLSFAAQANDFNDFYNQASQLQNSVNWQLEAIRERLNPPIDQLLMQLQGNGNSYRLLLLNQAYQDLQTLPEPEFRAAIGYYLQVAYCADQLIQQYPGLPDEQLLSYAVQNQQSAAMHEAQREAFNHQHGAAAQTTRINTGNAIRNFILNR